MAFHNREICWWFCVNIHGAAKNELINAPRKSANITFSLFWVKANHIDDSIKTFKLSHLGFKGLGVIPIALDDLVALGKAWLSLPTIIKGQFMPGF